MGKCALCNTPGVNKSTCPLFVKNPTEDNWKKHYLVKKKGKEPISIKQPSSIGRTPPVKKFLNPYVEKSKKALLVKNKMLKSFNSSKYITLHGEDLIYFNINIKDPKKIKIKIYNTPSRLKKISDYLTLIIDINIGMSKLLVTRRDFFTNPDSKTVSLIKLLENTKNALLDFVFEHYDGPGGGSGMKIPSYTIALDEVLEDLERMDTFEKIKDIPSVPTTIPEIVSTKQKKQMVHARKRHKTKRKKHKLHKTKKI